MMSLRYIYHNSASNSNHYVNSKSIFKESKQILKEVA